MYGSYLLKSFGSDFKDNGDYYSLTGYMWLDGSVFSDGPYAARARLHGGALLRADGLCPRRDDHRA